MVFTVSMLGLVHKYWCIVSSAFIWMYLFLSLYLLCFVVAHFHLFFTTCQSAPDANYHSGISSHYWLLLMWSVPTKQINKWPAPKNTGCCVSSIFCPVIVIFCLNGTRISCFLSVTKMWRGVVSNPWVTFLKRVENHVIIWNKAYEMYITVTESKI